MAVTKQYHTNNTGSYEVHKMYSCLKFSAFFSISKYGSGKAKSNAIKLLGIAEGTLLEGFGEKHQFTV